MVPADSDPSSGSPASSSPDSVSPARTLPPTAPASPALASPELPCGFTLRFEPPAEQEYVDLRARAGLTPRTLEQARPALAHSWAWATIRDAGGTLAAMGRVIGDGGWCFHLADMATHPDRQRQGLGRAVLDSLLARIVHEAPPDPYITLMADPPGRRLYASAGFVDADPTLGMRLSSAAIAALAGTGEGEAGDRA